MVPVNLSCFGRPWKLLIVVTWKPHGHMDMCVGWSDETWPHVKFIFKTQAIKL